MKFFITIISAIFFLTSVNSKEIKMGKADWDTGFFQAEIYKKALEIIADAPFSTAFLIKS